ncbi:RHS repeat-associated core domain-containing protein [Agaribacter flavus]|uniref:RHS repeat-associated core domain-containing protein n=1 Tax=Agaribacter flavus TaxID=1902781 RepID=A0ABV7FRH3_9ALTE
MNGRIYDPTLGRFLQADPHVQAPSNSQSYNRYSYVLNNPLSYTDPSGYFFKSLFKAAGKLWQATTGSLLRALARVPILNAAAGFAACTFGGPLGCAAFAAASTYAVTGSLKGALIDAFTAYIGGGHGFLTSGLIGGLASKVQGGNFGHGFWSAGFGAALGGRIKLGNAYANVIASAVIGGTVSKLTGGKFANGAQTWAFSAAIAQDWSGNDTVVVNSGSGDSSSAEIVQAEFFDENGNPLFEHDSLPEALSDGHERALQVKGDSPNEFGVVTIAGKRNPDGSIASYYSSKVGTSNDTHIIRWGIKTKHVKSLVAITHSHPNNFGFSPGDKDTYNTYKERSPFFTGIYMFDGKGNWRYGARSPGFFSGKRTHQCSASWVCPEVTSEWKR